MIQFLQRRSSRSTFVSSIRSVIVAALLLSSITGCSTSDAPSDPATPITGSFVGLAKGTALPTVVTFQTGQADASGKRKVTAYACDSKEQGTIIWFVGELSGNDFTLRSSNGEATMTGSLTEDSVVGNLVDAAVSFPFSLRRANPGEGIYTVTIASNSDMQGISLDSTTRLEGNYPSLGAGAVGAMVTTTMIFADGSKQTFSEPSSEATGEGVFRANVIFKDGHFGVRGANFPVVTPRLQLNGLNKVIGLDMI